MATQGYPGSEGDNSQFDVTNNAGSGGGDGFNPYATTNNKPATLDINVTGGFLQGTGSVADNLFNDVQHGGGRIFFPSASVEAAIDRTEYPASRYRIPPKQSRRFAILNERQIALQRPLEVYDFEGDRFVYPELDSSLLQFSMSFENSVVTPATSSFFLGSYADITFGNLRTYSGDIHRMKVYAKYQNDQSDQETRIGDFIVRDKNELIDRNSVSGQAPIGIFYSQSVVDNNWVSSSNTSGPIQKNDSEIMSAVLLSGSNYNDGEFFDFKTSQYVPLVKAQDYIVNFASYFIKKPKQQPDGSIVDRAQIEVLLSGSVESSNQHLLSLGTISGLGDDSSETLEGKISGSIPNLFNYFTTYGGVGTEPSASLVFRVHAGQFHIGRVQLRPLTFSNFHPDSYRVKLPMPKKAPRNQQYDFRVEFFDFNNNKSQFTTESTASIFFTGTNDVLDGLDNHIEGAQSWGNAMEAYGVSGNSAYLRTIGYNGFDKTTAGTGERNGGFMLWSGSIGGRITASEAYNGVGLEVVDASDADPSNHRFLQFASNYKNTGNSRFRVQTNEFLLGISSSASNNYISGSNGNLEISSSNFELNGATGNVTLQGTITAEAGGTIGGFTIGSNDIHIGNSSGDDNYISIDSSNRKFRIGQKASLTDSNSGVHIGTDGIALGASSVFKVTNAGALTATSGVVGGWTLGSTLSSTNILLDPATPKITLGSKATLTDANTGAYIGTDGIALGASSVFKVEDDGTLTATAGTIGGWTLSNTTLTGGTITLDSAGIIEAGGLTGISDTSNTGFYVDNSGQILIRQSATDFLKFSGGSLDLNASLFNLRTGNLIITDESEAAAAGKIVISGTDQHIKVGTGVSIDGDGDSNAGQITVGGNVTLNGSSDSSIAGWTIGTSTISNNNLIINSAGFIETQDFASGVIAGSGKGFRLSAEGNGYLEVENARIRGTLSTAVFEKETVNAVGGILMVGNSTVITGSGGTTGLAASSATMSVKNASGFTGSYNGFTGGTGGPTLSDINAVDGEILMIKKVDNTGFSTEYVLVQSASFNDTSGADDGTDLSGKLYVSRSFNGAVDGIGNKGVGNYTASFVPGGNAQDYEDGQVIVSTGKYFGGTGADTQGTGFIVLNAKPNDVFTPYIDLVERTGSKVYEMDLKTRLGDLSGLSSGLVGTKPGFGLYTSKLFLRADNADSASIAVGGATDINTGNGFFVDGGGNFRVGGTSNNFLKFTGGTLSISVPDIDINSTDFTLDASGIDIESSDATITLGEGNLLLDGGDSIIKIGATTNKQVLIEGSSTVGKIYTGKTDVSQTTAGFWIANNDGDPEFHVGDAAEFIKFDGGALSIKSSDIDITATTFNLNANSGDLLIDSSAKTISLDGGTITLDGSGTGFLDIGNLTGVTDTASSNKGLYATGDGTLLLKAAANEFLQINNSKLSASFSSLDIDTSTLDMSTANGGSFALGGATTFGTAGVFMSGSGGVSFYKDADNFFIMSGSIMDFTSQNLVVSSSTGTGASYKDLRIDTTVPQIRIQKDNSSNNENIIDIDGADGTIEVTVDGDLIFNSGEFEDMKTTINRIINSAPTTTAPSTVNAPVTKVSNLKVSSNVDVDGTAFVDKGLLQQVTDNTTGFSTAFLSEINPVSYTTNTPANTPVQQVFNVVKNVGATVGSGEVIMQSTAFNTTINGTLSTAGVQFTDSGNTNLSSSLYQFQGILAQSDGGTATGYFDDGKACLMSLDMDTQDIHSSVREQFVYLQARRDIGAGLKTKFQVQGPNGAVASAGNITAFASSFNSVSDRRLKKDIHTISGSMNKILQLRPTEFTWIEQDKQDVGFIAQEVEEIIPEVIEMTDGFIDTETGEKSHENTKTIAYTKLIPYLVDTIQQMDKRIKELEERDN